MYANRRIDTASNRRGRVEWRFLRRQLVLALIVCVFSLFLGCGGRSGDGPLVTPISIHLPVSTVTIVPGGAAVSIGIQINSPSETALVSVGGLPAGVAFKYSSSDTNPSGILTFTATATTNPGTYTPTITVMSARQTVSTGFTLIAKSA